MFVEGDKDTPHNLLMCDEGCSGDCKKSQGIQESSNETPTPLLLAPRNDELAMEVFGKFYQYVSWEIPCIDYLM